MPFNFRRSAADSTASKCWDNSIRGLDSAVALRFLEVLKELSRSTGMANVSNAVALHSDLTIDLNHSDCVDLSDLASHVGHLLRPSLRHLRRPAVLLGSRRRRRSVLHRTGMAEEGSPDVRTSILSSVCNADQFLKDAGLLDFVHLSERASHAHGCEFTSDL